MNVFGDAFLILAPIALGGLSLITYGHGSDKPNYYIFIAPVLIIIEIILIVTNIIQV
jgi:hypothetical protein